MPLFWNKFISKIYVPLMDFQDKIAPLSRVAISHFVGNDVTVDSKSLLFYQPVGGDIEVKVLWNTTPDCVKCFDD